MKRQPAQQAHCDFVDALREFLRLAPLYRADRPTNYCDVDTHHNATSKKGGQWNS